MFSVVIDILKGVVDFLQKTEQVNIESKKRISQNLDEISSILNDTAEKLKRDEYPHMNCTILEHLSDNLQFQISDILTFDELEKLRSSLRESSLVERQYAIRKEPDTIPSIEKAAGEFKSMSILLNF